MTVSFTTEILREGNHASIEIPDSVLRELRANKRAPLLVSINGHSYRSTAVGVGGACRVVFPQRDRELAGVSEGEITVHVQLESGRRVVELLPELLDALTHASLLAAFEASSYSRRREWANSVAEAKRPATRARRIQNIIDAVKAVP